MQRKHPMDVASPAFIQQDYAHYRWMRAEAPVYRGRYGRLFSAYMLSRYADVSAALKDPRLVRDRRNALPGPSRLPIWLPKPLRALSRSMILSDEPDHRRLRTLVHKAFTPRVVAGLAPRIEALTHELIGVPRDDRPRFLAWSQRAVAVPSALGFVGWYRALRATMGSLEGLIAERRRNPQDDLLTGLVQAEEAGDQLDMVILLLGAANRDEAAFPNPDLFDIRRTPNRHLGYGHGIHYCLGAPLARLEGAIALTTLVQRYPNLRLAVAPERLRYKAMPLFHRLEALPVRFG